MGRFTVRDEAAVDARVEADLAVVRAEAESALGADLVGLAVVGGFGRGEGSVLIRGGEVRALNDYDLVAIVRERRPVDALQGLGDALAGRLGLAHVDLLPIARDDLPLATPTIFTVDMKRGSIALSGGEDLLAAVPDHDAARLPAEEARRLLLNRLTCPLESATAATLTAPGRPSEELAMAYMAAKVAITAVEARLVLSGGYETSYREKATRYDGPEADFARAMTEFKLRPETPVPFDPRAAWRRARQMYLDAIRAVSGSGSWDEWVDRHLSRMFFRTRRAWNLLADRRKYRDWTSLERRRRAEAAELLLLAGLDEPAGGPSLVRARRLLAGLVPGRPLETWEDLRSAAVRSDDLWIHPHARRGPDLFGPSLSRWVDEGTR